ncbi:MAG: ABC transporter permease [bacterium]|nr:ABC transporter permease [bacterium]
MANFSTYISNLGRKETNLFRTSGEVILLLVSTLSSLFKSRPRWDHIIRQMLYIGYESIPIVLLTAVFIGMIMVLQTGYQLTKFGATLYAGGIAAIALAREIAPVFTAFSIAARVGASIAAEIGTMRVTEQIDALETLATDPVQYLVVPRFVAAIFVVPLLTILALFIGIMGGMLVGVTNLGISTQLYLNTTRDFLVLRDIYSGLIKTVVFAGIIAIMGCYQGFKTSGGAEGVGRATRNAVVASIILIIISDYFLTTWILAIW